MKENACGETKSRGEGKRAKIIAEVNVGDCHSFQENYSFPQSLLITFYLFCNDSNLICNYI